MHKFVLSNGNLTHLRYSCLTNDGPETKSTKAYYNYSSNDVIRLAEEGAGSEDKEEEEKEENNLGNFLFFFFSFHFVFVFLIRPKKGIQ